MKINPILYGVIVLVVFFGIILGFQSAGVWTTSGKVDSSGKAIQPSVTDASTIKGWMTLEQIVTTYNIPLEEILVQFILPADTPISTALKDLESDTFDTSILISWLQNRGLSESELQVQNVTSVPTQTLVTTQIDINVATPAPTEHIALEQVITGKTTFQDLVDWEVPVDAIEKVIGGKIPVLSTIIKDFVIGKGLEFSDTKTLLQVEVDK